MINKIREACDQYVDGEITVDELRTKLTMLFVNASRTELNEVASYMTDIIVTD